MRIVRGRDRNSPATQKDFSPAIGLCAAAILRLHAANPSAGLARMAPHPILFAAAN
jgi:hypothetical protein